MNAHHSKNLEWKKKKKKDRTNTRLLLYSLLKIEEGEKKKKTQSGRQGYRENLSTPFFHSTI